MAFSLSSTRVAAKKTQAARCAVSTLLRVPRGSVREC